MAQRKFGYSGGRTSADRSKGLNSREQRLRILIVCEGAETEKNYFENRFRVSKIVADVSVKGTGRNTLSLIEEAEKIADIQGPFDEVWCVFDRDSFPADNFDNCVASLKSKKKYNAAYSNESFELWFLLHFENLSSAIGRKNYNRKLAVHLGFRYEKNDPNVYNTLEEKGDEKSATKRAENLLLMHGEEIPVHQRKPSTTVHLLVARLRALEKAADV